MSSVTSYASFRSLEDSMHSIDSNGAEPSTAQAQQVAIVSTSHMDDLYSPKAEEQVDQVQNGTSTDVLFYDSGSNSPVCPGCGPNLSQSALILLLTITTILSSFGLRVSFTAYVQEVETNRIETDLYCLFLFCFMWTSLFFILLTVCWRIYFSKDIAFASSRSIYVSGVMFGVFFMLYTMSMDVQRTPAYLQYILILTIIPFVIICRTISMGTGFSASELSYSAISLSSVFVTFLPYMLGITPSASPDMTDRSLGYQVGWAICFLVAIATLAIYIVRMEKEMKKDEVHPLHVVTWLETCKFLTLIALLWTNILPHFGLASNGHLSTHFHVMLKCHFDLEPDCAEWAWLAWIFIAFYCLFLLSFAMLLHVTKSAVYTVMATFTLASITQLMWWSFVNYWSLDWEPSFGAAQGFAVPGFLGCIVAVHLYRRRFKVIDSQRQIVEDVMSRSETSDNLTFGNV